MDMMQIFILKKLQGVTDVSETSDAVVKKVPTMKHGYRYAPDSQHQ